MNLVDRIDDLGRGGWIAVTVLSFVFFWPLGLVVLGFLYGSGRMGCWHHDSGAPWGDRWQRKMNRMQRGFDRMQQGMERMQAAAERFRGAWQARGPQGPGYQGPAYQGAGHQGAGHQGPGYQGPSGNRAFDEYRTETLRRLEDEQREFLEFLERLRHAKDKAEFDQFMTERRSMRDATPPSPQS
ncbi:MAG TPA: DUF2852 domain-containing protein [Stellaceae bacterium]|jgi:hypothetical protein|nr:DUF2852 domain-containing protein [Stellaceae bacterium]